MVKIRFLEIFVLLISGVIALMTQVSAQVIPKDFEHLVLEVILQPAKGNPSGSRVFDDGRYEFLSDSEIIVANDGSSTRKTVELKWREVYVFTPSELSELQKAIQDANFPSLNAVYPPSGNTFNTSTMTWCVLVAGEVKRVVVQGYPINKVAALEILYKRFNQIHKAPRTSSVWRVWTKTGIVKRTFDCDVSSLDLLRPVLQALFTPNQNATSGGNLPFDRQTVVLEIRWHDEGKAVEQTRLYGDGRYVEVGKDSESVIKTLSTAQMIDFLKTLQAVSWDQLPEPVCEQ